jgi:hypothetical protein
VTGMNFKIKSVIGFLVITSVIFVYSLFVSEMTKMPLNYELISEHEGQDRILESIGGELSKPFWIREVLKENVVNVNGNILEINSTVVGTDSATNHIIFSNANTFFVDRTSRKHQSMDEYFTFPPNVQKRNYEFFHPMIFTKTTLFSNEKSKLMILMYTIFLVNIMEPMYQLHFLNFHQKPYSLMENAQFRLNL